MSDNLCAASRDGWRCTMPSGHGGERHWSTGTGKSWARGERDCTCVDPMVRCTEDETDCDHCRQIDFYDPCPARGFGCGTYDGGCDCCTPEQQGAAMGALR